MLDAAWAAFKAAKAKDAAGVEAVSDQLYESCVSCHKAYRPDYGKPKPPPGELIAVRMASQRLIAGGWPDEGTSVWPAGNRRRRTAAMRGVRPQDVRRVLHVAVRAGVVHFGAGIEHRGLVARFGGANRFLGGLDHRLRQLHPLAAVLGTARHHAAGCPIRRRHRRRCARASHSSAVFGSISCSPFSIDDRCRPRPSRGPPPAPMIDAISVLTSATGLIRWRRRQRCCSRRGR